MPKLTKPATPLWREFEQLVARVEQVMVGDRVKVTSPDRVRSLLTGRGREVDASIRATIGSSEILVTIECRRRNATQDVTWLEQLGCKKQAIGAARTIAVSSSAFSSDALRVAGHYGIDLRILSKISDTDMQNWMLPQFVGHVFKQCDLTESPEITFVEEKGADFTTLPPMTDIENGVANLDSAVFISADGTKLTLNELWLRADEEHKIFDGVPTDDQVHLRRLTLTAGGKFHQHRLPAPEQAHPFAAVPVCLSPATVGRTDYTSRMKSSSTRIGIEPGCAAAFVCVKSSRHTAGTFAANIQQFPPANRRNGKLLTR